MVFMSFRMLISIHYTKHISFYLFTNNTKKQLWWLGLLERHPFPFSRVASSVGIMYCSSSPNIGSNSGGGRIQKKLWNKKSQRTKRGKPARIYLRARGAILYSVIISILDLDLERFILRASHATTGGIKEMHVLN